MNALQPGHPQAYVRLTEPAVADLHALLARDPQILRAALRKMLLLERSPHAGEPLLGALIGWRKLVVGDRHWRIVWRVSSDANGNVVLTICEVWAVGARSDDEVYREMLARIDAAGKNPATAALAEVAKMLAARLGAGAVTPASEPIDDPVPPWLRQRLIHNAGFAAEEIDAMSGAEAMDRWERFITRGG